ncbi:MAG: hypothetical protein HUK15_05540 [Bacteroidales bacterium]|nr:hypothetical protein [Bacteroidales bacterium]
MNGETYYIIPASKISIPASKEQILKTQSLYPGYTSDTADYFDTVLNIDLNREYLMKNEMMILDLISTNNWERPIYITSIGSRNTMGLDNYFHNEGFAFRLMPVNKKAKAPEGIANNDINTDVMYENLMNKYSWGNLNDPNVYIDPTITRTMNIVKIRANFGELAKSLIKEGKTEEAKKVMARCEEVMPTSLYPIDLFDCHYVEAYYMLGMGETADKILKEGADIADQELTYFSTLDRYQRAANNTEIQMCLATIQYVLQIFDENQREELFQTYYSVFFNHRQWYD